MSDELRFREGDQQLPEANDHGYIQDLVIADIEERRQLGINRYGTALQSFNGRDALRDAYEEAIDLCMYLKQTIVERDSTSDPFHCSRCGKPFPLGLSGCAVIGAGDGSGTSYAHHPRCPE